MNRLAVLILLTAWFAVLSAPAIAAEQSAAPASTAGWSEGFEQYKVGESLTAQSAWRHGRPERTDEATATVVDVGAFEGKQAAAIYQDSPTNRVFFIHRDLPVMEGQVWVDARIKTARTPSARTALTIYDDRQAATHVGFTADGRNVVFSTIGRSYWRVFRDFPCSESRWYRLTQRIDFSAGTWSLWVDGQLHSTDLPLLQDSKKATGIRISACGPKDDPALVDSLYVGPNRPADIELPSALPSPEPGHLFRFALFGDPQIGFGDRTPPHTLDVLRVKAAIRQAESAGCELVLCCGDLVHQLTDDTTAGLLEAVGTIRQARWCPVSGNHDPDVWYQEHIGKPLDYSFEHKGVTFIGMKTWAAHHQGGVTPSQLAWLDSRLQTARDKQHEIVVWCHVTPYGPNPQGWWVREGQEEMLRLCREYKVLAVMAGHFHRELWHFAQDGTHHVIAPGITLSRGDLGWVVYDVYPDRVVQHFKPLWNAAPTHAKGDGHIVSGTMVFPRHAPAR